VTRRRPSSREPGARPIGCHGRPAGQRPQPRRQLFVGERLHEIVVRAGIQARDAIAHRVASREHEDAQAGSPFAQAPRDLQARDVRQSDVEDQRLDAGRLACGLQPAAAVGLQLHDVTILLQQSLEEAAELRVVFND
jgi:hypothetical protein